MMRLKGLSAIALLSVVPLAACGSSKTASQATSAATSAAGAATSAASSAAGDSSAGQSPSASAPSASASVATPAGDKMVTDTPAKVQFAVPSSWLAIDAKSINTPAVRKALTPMAKNTGKTVDQVLQQFAQDDDLYLMAPNASDHGYADNLSALKPKPTDDFDTIAGQFKQGAEGQGAKVSKQSRVQTPLGEGLRTDYTMAVNGQTFGSVSLILPTPDGKLVPLTVSAGTPAQADKFAQDVLKTYHAA